MRTGVIVSGGDAAGVNGILAGILATAGEPPVFFHQGFTGIVEERIAPLDKETVYHHVTDGWNLLQTSRSKLPLSPAGRKQILDALYRNGVDSLVVCGGDGSFRACHALELEGLKCVGVPLTIDNNIPGTEETVGYDTAVEQIKDALRSLAQTAHCMPGRVFIMEVFGAETGHLALASGLAGGADILMLPEFSREPEALLAKIDRYLERGRESVVIVCSEGCRQEGEYASGQQGCSVRLTDDLQQLRNLRMRYSVLGYYQRAGEPTARDILLGQRLGAMAVSALRAGMNGMVGVDGGGDALVPFAKLGDQRKPLDNRLLNLARNKDLLLER